MARASGGFTRVGWHLAALGAFGFALSVHGSHRADAVPVASVGSMQIDRSTTPVSSVVSQTNLDVIPLSSTMQRLPDIPVVLQISGETGDARTVSLTSDNTGVAHYTFTPQLPGLINFTAFNDANRNGVRDAGETSITDSTIVAVPLNNLDSSLIGSGQVDFQGLFPGATAPVLGTFSMNLKTSSAGKPSGKFSFSIPDRQFGGVSTHIDSMVGFNYTPMVSGAYVEGTLRLGSSTRWFGFTAVDGSPAGTGDAFRLSLYNGPGQAAASGGGPLIPRNGLRNQLTYKVGTRRDWDELFVWPRQVDYGTVHPQQFYPKSIYFMNTWTSPLGARLDTSHLDISYFNFFPTASEFTIPGGQYYSLISTFSSRRSCTHRGFLRVSSLGFTGGALDVPFSVVSKF